MSEPLSSIVPTVRVPAWSAGAPSAGSPGPPPTVPGSAVGEVVRGGLRQQMLLHQWLSVSNTIIAFVLFLACALALGSDPILFALALVLLAPCILANSALRLRGGRRAASLSVVSGGLLGMGSLFALYTAVLFFWETFIFSPPLWGTGLSLIIVVTCLAFAALLGSAAVRAFAAARLFGRLPARTGALPIPRSSIAAGEDAD